MSKMYVGIDPGFTGAIGLIDDRGEYMEAWDLPVGGGSGRNREFDEAGLNLLVYRLRQMQEMGIDLVVGLEKPASRQGEAAHSSHRFGEGIGMLRGMLSAHMIGYRKISPNLWKGRLGLPGKQIRGANKACAQYLVTFYPVAERIVYGSKGGVKDGRLDALLIAHWLKKEDQNEQS